MTQQKGVPSKFVFLKKIYQRNCELYFKIQAQSKIPRKKSPFYVSNLSLQIDIRVVFVKDLEKQRYAKLNSFLRSHPNTLV